MDHARILALTEDDALQQIVETVQEAEVGAAPFALVLGSGFSHGLVPTVREIVEVSLPLWSRSLNGNETFDQLLNSSGSQSSSVAREFWETFVSRNAKRNLDLPLDPTTGLPEDYPAAYRAAFNHRYRGGLPEPAQASKFQRAVMQLDKPRLNAAHFLLASLLGVQPGRSRRNDLFKARAAFCRLILTTNFDPFLQIALQLVNHLYFMSDTPEVEISDEILDEPSDAIHLVYVHGSIHRRSQAASEAEIKKLTEKNASILASVLKRRGVIVLGYSGWGDAIVEALDECTEFAHLLYWCGLEVDPLRQGAFGPQVAAILQKPTANYVQISSAGNFTAKLYSKLVHGAPRLLDNPIGQLRQLLDMIDLSEFESIAPRAQAGSTGPQPQPTGPQPESAASAFVAAKKTTSELLAQAERAFVAPPQAAPVSDATLPKSPGQPMETPPSELGSLPMHLLTSARTVAALGDYEEAIRLFTQVLGFVSLNIDEKAGALLQRGLAFYFSGDPDKGQADWSSLIELPGAPVQQVAQALNNRGVAWGQKGDTDKELADYTRVIEQLPGAPVEHVAQALNNRGVTWGQQGDTDKALADYTRVIEQLPGAPVEQVAQALYNRGFTWGQQGDTDRELADYTRVIEQLPGAPVEQVAQALTSRGWLRYQRNAFEAFLSDTESAVGKDPTLDFAAFNLGLALLACGRDVDAWAAYKRAPDQFPEAVDSLGLCDLAEAEKVWLREDRARPIRDVLQR